MQTDYKKQIDIKPWQHNTGALRKENVLITKGEQQHIKVVEGVQYKLTTPDGEDTNRPHIARKVGNDLIVELEDDTEVIFDDYYITEGSTVFLPNGIELEPVGNLLQSLEGATDVVHYYGSEQQIAAILGGITINAAYLAPLLALGGGGGGGRFFIFSW